MSHLLAGLIPDQGSPGLTIKWGTVSTSTPLTVLIDGDTTPSPPTATLAGGLSAGDYVCCLFASKQLIILGRYGG